MQASIGGILMKTLKRKMLAILMVCIMTACTSTVAFAAESNTNTEDTVVLTLVDENGATHYVYVPIWNDDPVSGTVGTTCSVPAGTYKFAYSVTTSGTFGFFTRNGYDGGSFDISGTGERTLRAPLGMSQWYFIPDNQSVSYSYAFTIYD